MKKAINILMADAMLSTCAAAPLSTYAAEVSVSEKTAIPSYRMDVYDLYDMINNPSDELDSRYDAASLEDVLTQICGDYVYTYSYSTEYYPHKNTDDKFIMSPDGRVHIIDVLYPELVVQMKEGAEFPASDIEAAVTASGLKMPNVTADGNKYRIEGCVSKEKQFNVIMDILRQNDDVDSIKGNIALYEDKANYSYPSYGIRVSSPSGMGIVGDELDELIEAAAANGFKEGNYQSGGASVGEFDLYLSKDTEAEKVDLYGILKYLSDNGYRYAVPCSVTEVFQMTSDVYFCNITYPVNGGAEVKRLSASEVKVKGDANNDGQMDMADVVLIMQSLANPNKYQLTEQGRINADMDGNGITVADAQAIQMMLLGLDKEKEPPVSEIASLDFKTADEVIKAVNNTDLSKYESPYREAYKDMFARFKSDGFIYSVKTNDDVKIKDNSKIWLQPYHALMDVYIKYSVTYKGKNYDVLFRNADADTAAKTSGITEYLSKREKRDTYQESVFDGKTYAVLLSTDGSQIAASTFTDDKHYVTVVGHGTSQDELREMLGALEYEKLSINTGDDPLQPSTPQPIGFKDVDEVITLMHRYVSGDHSDLNNYPEKYREDYQQIFERFFEDGCVWQVVNTEDVSIKEGTGTSLFPRTKYEDIGIGYYVTYNGKTYHVTFYCADRGVLSETDGIAEYLKKRMGRSSDKMIETEKLKASLLFADNGQTYANAFIGDKHYIDVIGISSEEEMTGFLNALVIYKNYLTQICVQQPPTCAEDAGFTTEGGKRVSFGLYAALRQYENTNVQIAVTPKYNTDGNYVYNGKTIQQYHNEWDEESDLSEKYGQLLKEGDKLKYGEALYTTGAPDGEKWDKDWYDIRVDFYGEDFLAKYIVNGEFLRDKVLADQEEYLNGNTINHAYNMLHEAIDAYETEMMQETVSQLEAQNIRYEYINGGKNLAFYVTAAQFEDLAINVSSFGLAADTMSPIADDMGMVVYTHDD